MTKVTIAVAQISFEDDGRPDGQLRSFKALQSVVIFRNAQGEVMVTFADADGRAIAWSRKVSGLEERSNDEV